MDSAESVLKSLVEWFQRVDDGAQENGGVAGNNYLNGDSDKYPGYAWDDCKLIVERAKRLLEK